MLKWKIGGAFTHGSEKMSSPSTKSTKNNAQDPSTTTTSTTKSSSSSITSSTLSATAITSAANSPSNSTRSSCSSSSSSTINTKRRGGGGGGTSSSSDSSGPNKSFLHQNFVTGSCPSDEYYDGTRLSTLARKHQFERQLSTRSAGSVDSCATLTPVKEFLQELEDSDEDSLVETEISLTKEVLAAIQGDHYSMPMNNTLVSTLPSEPTTNPTTNLTLNPTTNLTPNPTLNTTTKPTTNPTTNLTPNPTPNTTTKLTPNPTTSPTTDSTTNTPTYSTINLNTANDKTKSSRDTTKSTANAATNTNTNDTNDASNDAVIPSTSTTTKSTTNLTKSTPKIPSNDTTTPTASPTNLSTNDTVKPIACLTTIPTSSTSPSNPYFKTDSPTVAEETDVVDTRGCTSVSTPALDEATATIATEEAIYTLLPPGPSASVEVSQDIFKPEKASARIYREVNIDEMLSKSIPRMYYYGLEPEMACASSTAQCHYAIPKGNKPVPQEIENPQSHYSSIEEQHSDRRPTERSEAICRHYDVPKNLRKSSVQDPKKSEAEASKNDSEETKDGKSSKKHRVTLNIRKAFGQHSKTLRRLKEFVRHSEASTSSTTREAKADEDHYKTPKKSSNKQQQQYSKTLPIIRSGKKKNQRVSEAENERLKLALDFRDAKSYLEAKEIRKLIEKGKETGGENSENLKSSEKNSVRKGDEDNSGKVMVTETPGNCESSGKSSSIFFKSGKSKSKTIDSGEKRSKTSKNQEKGSGNIKKKEKSLKKVKKNDNTSKNGVIKNTGTENHKSKETHKSKASNQTQRQEDIRLDKEDHLRGGGGGGWRIKRRKEGKCEIGKGEEEVKKIPLPLLSPSLPPPLAHYHTFPRRRRPPPHTNPLLTSVIIPDGAYVELYPFKVR
ncbi:hypothetical protein Pmani_006106 [Petrolisthes manimaculis]|uniref:Uncharacterized protein n=1 Tax=Petrolisthes manimaculis TaxID=1843537 RepID=A0AAE1QDM2_9EUCA|nr:hypothetical protein Pmani_006106 [Petrolisthes manimaculis]